VSADLRPEVVGRLLAILHDDGLSTDDKLARVFGDDEATAYERWTAARVLAHASVQGLTETGVLREHTPSTVLDATMRQLQAAAATWGIVSKWDGSLKLDKKLGDMLKIMPTEDVDDVVRFIAWGGLMP
jgi:hypothetical protein